MKVLDKLYNRLIEGNIKELSDSDKALLVAELKQAMTSDSAKKVVVPQDGDVMRVQFTLALGSDIGSSMVGDLWFDAVDRDPLTKLIAKATEIGVDTEDAITVVSTFGITQDELDAACVELQATINAAQ